MSPILVGWRNIETTDSKNYVCGYCGSSLSSEKAYVGSASPGGVSYGNVKIYICHFCYQPTYFDSVGTQVPGAIYGNTVKEIPDVNVATLYDEARKCISSNSYTAAILCSRKLLMHIAVSKGADKSLTYKEYVDFLVSKNLVPPDSKDWIDHIRSKGNEANHEIVLMKKEDAEELIDFIGILLKMLYEFPASMRKKVQK